VARQLSALLSDFGFVDDCHFGFGKDGSVAVSLRVLTVL